MCRSAPPLRDFTTSIAPGENDLTSLNNYAAAAAIAESINLKTSRIINLVAALAAVVPPLLRADVIQGDPAPGAGVPYFWTVVMGENESGFGISHVGAWSWEDQSLFDPGLGEPPVGWTHTSNWVALTLLSPVTFTFRLERQAGVPWPSPTDPNRVASIDSMFPSFTLWANQDHDGSDFHSYHNRGNVSWAEDLSYLDHLDNSTLTAVERTWTLPAGAIHHRTRQQCACGHTQSAGLPRDLHHRANPRARHDRARALIVRRAHRCPLPAASDVVTQASPAHVIRRRLTLKHLLLPLVVLSLATPSRAHIFSDWLEQPVDGQWDNPLNWDGNVPNNAFAAANFFNATITNVTLSTPILVAGVAFFNSPSYTFSGSALSFDLQENTTAIGIVAPDPASQIVFGNPVHFFNSNLDNFPAFLQFDAGSSLVFAGGLTTAHIGVYLAGSELTPPAAVFVNGSAAAAIAGVVTVSPEVDLGGDGTITAPAVQINGGLRPGATTTAAPAALTINAALVFGSRSLSHFEIAGEHAGSLDRVLGMSSIAVSGTIHLRAVAGFNSTLLQAGTTFDLFDWSGSAGTDGGFGFALDPTVAPLATGLSWEMSNLLTHGTVHVAPALANVATGGFATASVAGTASNAFDGNNATAWTNGISGGGTGWVQYQFGGGTRKIVNRYTLVSSTDPGPRDPRDWQFKASNDGVNWITLGVVGNRRGVVFATRGGMKICAVINTTPYEFYRLEISANNSGTGLSLAELGLHHTPPPAATLAPEHLRSPEISINGDTVTLRAFSAVGRIYQLKRTSHLTFGTWENRGAIKTGTGGWLEFTDTLAPEERAQFYRLEIGP